MEVCRLCLDLIAAQGEAKLLDGEARDMVQVVAPELNLDVSDDPLACGECTESLAALFEFKSRCFEHEAEVREKVGERRGELTLRDALAGEAGGGGDRLEEPGGSRPKAKDRLCRTCLAPIECESFTVLQPSEPDAYLSSMLDMCLVEVDLELTKDPVMCENCLENLQKLHHFKSSCQDVEDKIVEYCETHKVKEGDTIELHKVLESEMAMPDVEMALVKKEPDEAGTSGAKVKTEKESDGGDASQGDEDMSDADDELKQEEIDIKSEAGTSDSDKLFCPICGVDTGNNIQRHSFKKHHDDLQFFCPSCSYKSDYFSNLVRHFNSGVHRSHLTCGLCGHATTDRSVLQIHISSTHRDGELYCCPTCDYKTKSYSNIYTHVRRVHFRCHKCNLELDSRKSHFEHMMIVHGKKMDKEYQCKICPFQCKNVYTLLRHRIEVHDDKEVVIHKCTRCSFNSPRKSSVTEHEKVVHDGRKNLACQFCDYSTREKQKLAMHLYNKHGVGEDITPVQCPHCPFQSAWRKNLTAHIRTKHDGIFQYNCQLCPFKTNDSDSYKLHRIKVHGFTDVVKHKCSRCSYTTLRRSNLKRHEQCVHDNVRIKCEHCDYSTKEMRSLRKHVCSQSSYNLSEQSNL